MNALVYVAIDQGIHKGEDYHDMQNEKTTIFTGTFYSAAFSNS